MGKQVNLTLLQGSLEHGFPVLLHIRDDAFPDAEFHVEGHLPSGVNISESFSQWQKDFQNRVGSRSRATPRGTKPRNSESSAKQLKNDLNNWLNSDEEDWRRIRDSLLHYLNPQDEIRVIIQTQNWRLRQLPWQAWELFAQHYPQSEIALSATNYQSSGRRPSAGTTVRILAVLGNSDNINIEFDARVLKRLEAQGVEIEFLEQPNKNKLLERLWDETGWYIFFFAGHSSSQADGQIGWFDINDKESLEIEELKNALRFAIERGLQIAIFNSCDGLGLANQLAALHLPQSIVMREPVPDVVAQEFLQDFLTAFAGGNSFYASVRLARRKLEDKWNKEYPGASWLPVICQNPAEVPPTWKEWQQRISHDSCNPRDVISTQAIALDNPEGQVELDSAFYVERPPIETDCYETIVKPGALIRIKAPRQMGKTSLLARIVERATQHDYRSVYLNFQSADAEFLSNLDQFLQWFCASITYELDLPDKLADYWKGVLGSKNKCTNYFQRYLLSAINSPLLLGLDEVDQVFTHPEIATDFFGLLRAWHEKAKNEVIWKKLRLVIVHSKEVYIPLNINQSPFNVGLPIELPELTQVQVEELVQRHGLNWSSEQIEQLMAMFGGHPYLVRLALYQIARGRIALEKLLQVAPTEEGPYYDHLRRHLLNLENDAKLVEAIAQVIAATSPVQIGTAEAFKLRSMGLVKFQGNAVMPLCEMYRLYFRDRLGVNR